MLGYVGWPQADGSISGVTDGCGCYDDNGNCYCAECYYYGGNAVNCVSANRFEDAKPVHWDSTAKKWVLD